MDERAGGLAGEPRDLDGSNERDVRALGEALLSRGATPEGDEDVPAIGDLDRLDLPGRLHANKSTRGRERGGRREKGGIRTSYQSRTAWRLSAGAPLTTSFLGRLSSFMFILGGPPRIAPR